MAHRLRPIPIAEQFSSACVDPAQQDESMTTAPRTLPDPAKQSRKDWTNPILWAVLVILLLLNVPVVLCMHLTSDTTMFDLQARCALDGGVLYQDIVEPNLPGIVWVHMLIRSLLGWSSVAIRVVDLFIVTGIGITLAMLARKPDDSLFGTRSAVLFTTLFGFYLGLNEWCHCQRDVWMLLPSLLATIFRAKIFHQLTATNQTSNRLLLRNGFFEGLLWATAFWIKPHIAIPAMFVIITSWILAGFRRQLLVDFAGVLLGGLLLGAMGSAWLIITEAWEPFWVMQLEWNPQYLKVGRELKSFQILSGVWQAFFPWNWIHVLAIGVSLWILRERFISQREETELNHEINQSHVRQLLLIALYVGWTTQALLLQFPFMYVHVAPLMLGLAIVASAEWQPKARPFLIGGCAYASFLIVMATPVFSSTRFNNWFACVTQGPTSEVRERIQLEQDPNWKHLAEVITYLQEQNVADGDLTVYRGSLIELYPQLGIKPSTRFVYMDVYVKRFENQHRVIHESIENSHHRFVVSSLVDAGFTDEELTDENPATKLPMSFPASELKNFPYNQPVVFRSGQYAVHQVTRPTGTLAHPFETSKNRKNSFQEDVAVMR